LKELIEKLEECYRGKEIHEIVHYEEKIPLEELFDLIDLRFQTR
jgi:hypothetical protein